MNRPGTHEFSVVSSQDIHIGRVVGLRIDEVVMPGGGTARREVVEHLGAVAVCALDADGAVTLVHQYRHPLRDRLWELPAGLLDADGEAPVDTAARELMEEAGLAARRWETLVDVAASPGFTDEVVRVFLARELTEVDREMHGEEEADLVIRKVPLAEAVRMALAGEIVNGATVGGVLAAHAVLTGAAGARPADAPWRDRPTTFASRER
ncbi:NUDIX domain-containing protein [Prauserella muralis]|uniref:ADP-ribose pyrophosphatase n=1 Tax=Prauserella muralis TaxID=588067 RepID=A0A2V4AHG8_9PSEU|nr:NUDIX hydrolase [Prauserella muralis]PXY19299.1 ADP-ribose pyrophosphatase [Prauserella muralis]TWE29246.1 ADP-ribose pyrophosphatase [Prauserella muralis]